MSYPNGKYLFGTVKVGEKGQIVIPKDARTLFNIKAGDTLLLLGDEEQGIAIVPPARMREVMDGILRIEKSMEGNK